MWYKSRARVQTLQFRRAHVPPEARAGRDSDSQLGEPRLPCQGGTHWLVAGGWGRGGGRAPGIAHTWEL